MVYRGSLQTDDPGDAPRLVRMTPLRSSRSNGTSTTDSSSIVHRNKPVKGYTVVSSAITTPISKSMYPESAINRIDLDRARLIEERRMCRERDIESVEKVILRTTGIKVGAPRLRNINEIRETVRINPATSRHENRNPTSKNSSRSRPKITITGSIMEEPTSYEDEGLKNRNMHYASSRPPSSMLANLKDLERLRSTPPSERNTRSSGSTRVEKVFDNGPKSSGTSGSALAKCASSNAAKIRADIMKIQQMFQAPNDRGSRGTSVVVNSSRNGVSNVNVGGKNRVTEKIEKSGDLNKTRLLAQKLIEASRGGNRDQSQTKSSGDYKRDEKVKDKKTSEPVAKMAEKNLKSMGKYNVLELGKQRRNDEVAEMREKHEQPQPPARKRRDSRILLVNEVDSVDGIKRGSGYSKTSSGSKNGGRESDLTRNESGKERMKQESGLERPDILDGLLKESDRQLEELQSDLTTRGRPRSHWRGFVQSMRLHDVELHSDSETESKKG